MNLWPQTEAPNVTSRAEILSELKCMGKLLWRSAMRKRRRLPFQQIRSRRQSPFHSDRQRASGENQLEGYTDPHSAGEFWFWHFICGNRSVIWQRSSNYRLKASCAHPVLTSITSVNCNDFPHPATLERVIKCLEAAYTRTRHSISTDTVLHIHSGENIFHFYSDSYWHVDILALFHLP